jgi:hypothetical protein
MLIYDINANPLNSVEWAFPLTECFHIVSFALSIGTVAVVDLRLLGLALPRQTASQLARDTSLWTLAGLIVVVFSGLMIFSSNPVSYLRNASFLFKMAALTVAVVYNYTIHRKVALSDPSPALGRLVGGISVLLWVSVVFGGLWIAFV